ncbi:MAG: DUF1015 domain-containing protein [Candidatus Binataceae bacterium]
MNLIHRIEPFRGLFYNPKLSGPLSDVIAPPYDLISPAMQESLYARSNYNVVRIELAREPDRYVAAARTLRDWIRDGVLVRPPSPAIYLYSQRFTLDERRFERHGFVVRIRLEEFRPGRILPHERTFPSAKKDRLELLSATATNISSVFGLYDGGHPNLREIEARVLERPPLLPVIDDLGIGNELRTIELTEEISSLQRALADACIFIADGHHRYETALEYRRLQREGTHDTSETSAYDYTMMTLVSCDDPGLVILPTHRVVKRLDPGASASFARLAGENFTIEEFTDSGAFCAHLKQAHNALGVALKGDSRLFILRLKNASLMDKLMPTAPPVVRRLEVSVLHAAIFDRIFGIKPESVRAGGNIEYTVDTQAALRAVAAGSVDGAFLMNAPSIRDVQLVSKAGATMPEKSTYFFPKLATGLVLNPLSD